MKTISVLFLLLATALSQNPRPIDIRVDVKQVEWVRRVFPCEVNLKLRIHIQNRSAESQLITEPEVAPGGDRLYGFGKDGKLKIIATTGAPQVLYSPELGVPLDVPQIPQSSIPGKTLAPGEAAYFDAEYVLLFSESEIQRTNKNEGKLLASFEVIGFRPPKEIWSDVVEIPIPDARECSLHGNVDQ